MGEQSGQLPTQILADHINLSEPEGTYCAFRQLHTPLHDILEGSEMPPPPLFHPLLTQTLFNQFVVPSSFSSLCLIVHEKKEQKRMKATTIEGREKKTHCHEVRIQNALVFFLSRNCEKKVRRRKKKSLQNCTLKRLLLPPQFTIPYSQAGLHTVYLLAAAIAIGTHL